MNLIDSDYETLRQLQRDSRQKRHYVKVTVLLMLHLGESPDKIALFLGISTDTIGRYRSVYQSDGLDFYLENAYLGYWGKLTSHQLAELTAHLTANFYRTSAAIGAYIQERFGVSYTTEGLVPLLHRLGFSYKKSKLVPCEADIDEQKAFVADFEKLLADLPATDVVYFADAVHPQHNTRSCYGWIPTGQEKEIPSVSGRKRLNLNGALNAKNVTDVVVVEGDKINSQNTWELYQKLEARHPDASNIYVICDNAAYYKSAFLTEKLKNSRIKQLFLPPYSPNLNLIERLWKFLRKTVIDAEFCRDFKTFRRKIIDFFENIQNYETELKNLLTLKFHLPKSQTNFF